MRIPPVWVASAHLSFELDQVVGYGYLIVVPGKELEVDLSLATHSQQNLQTLDGDPKMSRSLAISLRPASAPASSALQDAFVKVQDCLPVREELDDLYCKLLPQAGVLGGVHVEVLVPDSLPLEVQVALHNISENLLRYMSVKIFKDPALNESCAD